MPNVMCDPVWCIVTFLYSSIGVWILTNIGNQCSVWPNMMHDSMWCLALWCVAQFDVQCHLKICIVVWISTICVCVHHHHVTNVMLGLQCDVWPYVKHVDHPALKTIWCVAQCDAWPMWCLANVMHGPVWCIVAFLCLSSFDVWPNVMNVWSSMIWGDIFALKPVSSMANVMFDWPFWTLMCDPIWCIAHCNAELLSLT